MSPIPSYVEETYSVHQMWFCTCTLYRHIAQINWWYSVLYKVIPGSSNGLHFFFSCPVFFFFGGEGDTTLPISPLPSLQIIGIILQLKKLPPHSLKVLFVPPPPLLFQYKILHPFRFKIMLWQCQHSASLPEIYSFIFKQLVGLFT